MTVDFRSLQERLRQRLLTQIEARELSGMQLARETGFQQAHISNFLNRKRGLSLEAMDAILKARNMTLNDLLAERGNSHTRRRSLQAGSPEVSYVPLVDEKNCHASQVPYSPAKNALMVMSSRLARLRTKVPPQRQHWQRFVAIRVSAEDAWAMSPRLERGAIAVVDRHSNHAGETESIYVVQQEGRLVLRYIEWTGRECVLRPENRECPLIVLESRGRDPLAAIVGRVCMVIAEM